MPRLRRQARRRRERPQLAIGVWKWLRDSTVWDSLDDGTKWDTFFLAGGSIDDPKFWKPITRAVEAGEIEVSETKKHCDGDPPLLPSRNEFEVSHS
jgi:hypothetical protein